MITSSADPAAVGRVQERLGREKAGLLVEAAFAAAARGLVDRGFTRFVVAGGETSGAVVAALGAQALSIGSEIDPGVPWTRTVGGRDLALTLKSGNFGTPDFLGLEPAVLSSGFADQEARAAPVDPFARPAGSRSAGPSAR